MTHFPFLEKVQRRKSDLPLCFGNECDRAPIVGCGRDESEVCDADDVVVVVEERDREYWSMRTSSREMEFALLRMRSSSSRCSWNLDCMMWEGRSLRERRIWV